MSDLSIQNNIGIYQAQAAKADATLQNVQQDGAEFSKALAEEMARLQASDTGLTTTSATNPLSLYLPTVMSSTAEQGLESQLLMLCMMMSTGQADASTMMSVLSQAVTTMQNQSEKEKLRRTIMDSSYDNSILDQVNDGVFGGSTAAYPYEAWKACTPQVKNYQGQRSTNAYNAAIDQFQVQSNDRYANNKRGTGDTYCNIFVWDVTSAMGAEIPHYVDWDTGEIRKYPDTSGARELTANLTYEWLEKHGERYGWREVSAEQAQAHANAGGPAMTIWKNPSGKSGHMQMVRPLRAGETYDEQKGVAVAQAGSKRLNYTYADDVFSDRAMQALKYYVHD